MRIQSLYHHVILVVRSRVNKCRCIKNIKAVEGSEKGQREKIQVERNMKRNIVLSGYMTSTNPTGDGIYDVKNWSYTWII